jgi:hypothetical protein
MTNDQTKYKFCVISYIAGSRGAFLGHQLFSRYPETFSVQSGSVRAIPTIIGEYDTWHIYDPHFCNEVFYCHPNYKLDNLFETDAAKKLDKTKYNIIVTHHYTAESLEPLKQALIDHDVKILQIIFEETDHQTMFDRAYTAASSFGHDTNKHWQRSYKARELTASRDPDAIPVPLAILKDYKNPPDLTNILENFKL